MSSGWFGVNRMALDRELSGSTRRALFSPVELCLFRALKPRLARYTTGRFLDVGCGTMPYRRLAEIHCDEYRALDIEERTEGVDYIADVQDMPDITSESFHTVLAAEVLEHVPHPAAAVAEMGRILAPGGILLLSVPHLSRLHEEPHDYFRYTEHGLEVLVREAGLDLVEVASVGSLFSFLGHQLNTIVVVGLWGVPVVRYLVF